MCISSTQQKKNAKSKKRKKCSTFQKTRLFHLYSTVHSMLGIFLFYPIIIFFLSFVLTYSFNGHSQFIDNEITNKYHVKKYSTLMFDIKMLLFTVMCLFLLCKTELIFLFSVSRVSGIFCQPYRYILMLTITPTLIHSRVSNHIYKHTILADSHLFQNKQCPVCVCDFVCLMFHSVTAQQSCLQYKVKRKIKRIIITNTDAI